MPAFALTSKVTSPAKSYEAEIVFMVPVVLTGSDSKVVGPAKFYSKIIGTVPFASLGDSP